MQRAALRRLVREVRAYLAERVARPRRAASFASASSSIPLRFGKTAAHNFELLRNLHRLPKWACR